MRTSTTAAGPRGGRPPVVAEIIRPVAVVAALVWAGPARAEDPGRFEFEEPHMGTRCRIVLYCADRETANRAAKAAFTRIGECDDSMTDYRSTSELMRLCAKNEKTAGEPVPVSEDLYAVLTKAKAVWAASDGTFDVTVGPLVRLWRKARRTQRLPLADELDRARALVGSDKMLLTPAGRMVRLTTPGMRLDLGGIAKGYAADQALVALKNLGISRAMVGLGGDIAVGAPPPDRPGWAIDIAALGGPGPAGRPRRLRLANAAVSTSGDAEQFVEIDGVRYSHIVDPRTGLGLVGRRSVTVVAPHGVDSDSLTKALSILPPERGMALIESVDAAAGLVVIRADGKGDTVVSSSRLARYLDPATPADSKSSP